MCNLETLVDGSSPEEFSWEQAIVINWCLKLKLLYTFYSWLLRWHLQNKWSAVLSKRRKENERRVLKTNKSSVRASTGRGQPIKTTGEDKQLVAPVEAAGQHCCSHCCHPAHPSGLHGCSSCLSLIQTKLPITIIGTTQINCWRGGEALG